MGKSTATKEYVEQRLDKLMNWSKSFKDGNINRLFTFEVLDYDIENMTLDYGITVNEDAINKIGTAHGGFVAAIADETMGNAVHAFMGNPNYMSTTLDMSFSCLKAIYLGDKLRVHATVRHLGKRAASATCEIYRGDELCSISSESFITIKS